MQAKWLSRRLLNDFGVTWDDVWESDDEDEDLDEHAPLDTNFPPGAGDEDGINEGGDDVQGGDDDSSDSDIDSSDSEPLEVEDRVGTGIAKKRARRSVRRARRAREKRRLSVSSVTDIAPVSTPHAFEEQPRLPRGNSVSALGSDVVLEVRFMSAYTCEVVSQVSPAVGPHGVSGIRLRTLHGEHRVLNRWTDDSVSFELEPFACVGGSCLASLRFNSS